jgi:hypothetical protein
MTDQIFYIWQILQKKWEYHGTVHQLLIDFTKPYDSVRTEVLYSSLIEFGIPRKLVGLIKICSNEINSIVHIGKYQSDSEWPERGRCFNTIAFQLCFGIHHYEGPGEPERAGTEWDTPASGLC